MGSLNNYNNATDLVIGNRIDTEDGTTLMSKIHILENHGHSRSESYPFLAAAIVLTGGGSAWAQGAAKHEIIPTATDDVNTLTITHSCDAAGNVAIMLDDSMFTCALVPGTTGQVATQLRAMTFADPLTDVTYAITGNGNDVVFTRLGRTSIARFIDIGTITKVTVTIVHTTIGVGVGDSFDIHFITPSAPDATTTYQVILWKGLAGFEERIGTVRLVKTGAISTLEPLAIYTPRLPGGTRVSASLATLAGGTNNVSISLGFHIY